ncbi:MAG: beta-galactosidase trimerization domain-containing protein [Phycisphaerae bacterium]|nr:beta-galactosidase trimerization domain-containing protein [Phycisphaerae bacterium]
MQRDSRQDARGYTRTPYRLEHRPTHRLHSKDELLKILDVLSESGVKAWWYSAASKGSYPLFKSKYLPYRTDAVEPEYYQWLSAEAHKRDIVLFSWDYLNCAPLLTAEHPEWRFQFLNGDTHETPRESHFVCYNSPYGRLLKDYCVEVVGELGFDGIWFDGCYHSTDSGVKLACRCEFCNAKHREATGRDIPQTVDWTSRAFREFIEWRYDDSEGYWRSLSGYVRERCPDAIIVFNYFNRLAHDWRGGSPLRRMPMEGMIASEVDCKPQQLLLQHKILRALNDNYPTEVWVTGQDAVTPFYDGRPNPDPTMIAFHFQTSATAGGYGSVGPADKPSNVSETLSSLSKTMKSVSPYIDGEAIPFVGLVVSGATKDYAHPGDAWPTWRSVLGMHNLLNALHYPSEVLLDNMLTAEFLHRYPVVVLPDVQCMSEESAQALREYVETGGCLIALGATGTRTLLGDPRETGVLDELFRITWRDEQGIHPVMEIASPMLQGQGLPARYMMSGLAHLVRSDSAEVLARAKYRPGPGKVFTEKGLLENTAEEVMGDVILSVRHGKGNAFYLAQDVGGDYALNTNRRSREVIRRIVESLFTPPLETNAPPNVVVAPRRQGGKTILHLLNVPSQMLHIDGTKQFHEDFVPVDTISITYPGRWAKASSPTHPDGIGFELSSEEITLFLTGLVRHAIIVIE